MSKKIIIAGAGIGGLTAAIAHVRKNHRVCVLEQAPELGEVGAGIQLSPNAMKVLASLGVDRRVQAVAFEPEGGHIKHYKSAGTITYTPFKGACEQRYGAKYLHVHRADLHSILLQAARELGVEIVLNARVASYAHAGGGVIATTADGRSHAGDVLVGADGIHSAIRAQMLGADNPEFTGNVAWRAVIPKDRIPAGLVEPNSTIWVGPHRHVVTYYLRGGELINIAAFEERSAWASESWRDKGDPDELRAAFRGWNSQVTRLFDAVDECHIWALFARKPLATWVDGRVALLGDACHPMLPYLAQGAAMAIEDASVLADYVSDTDLPTTEALKRYEHARKPRTSMVQHGAAMNAKLYHMSGGVRGHLRLAFLKMALSFRGGSMASKLDPLYMHDATVRA